MGCHALGIFTDCGHYSEFVKMERYKNQTSNGHIYYFSYLCGMKQIGLLLLVIFLVGCDNELDIIEPSGDIPIVYGFLDPASDTQYIRIERAFVDPEVSALEIAQIPDSIYYPETVTARITNNINQDSILLTRINGNLEGLIRDEGVFVQDPNYLYSVPSDVINIDVDAVYTLNLDRGNGLPLVTATTDIVGPSRFISPNPLSPDPRLNFELDSDVSITASVDDQGIIFDLYLDIFYVERMPGGSFEGRQVTWQVASNLRRDESDDSVLRHRQEGEGFFSALAARIPVVDGITRRFSSMTLVIEGGNGTLDEFLRVGQANLGITSTQDIPFFDNLSEGRGIFASKNSTSLEGITLTTSAIEELVTGEITGDLGFEF